MDANTMATAWIVIWFIIAIAIITHLGLNAYRESKRKRIKAEKRIEEQQKELEKELNELIQQRKENIQKKYDKDEEIDMEILDLLFGYEENNIVFNFSSFVRLLKQYEFRYAITSGHAHRFTFEISLNHRSITLGLIKMDSGINVIIYNIDVIAKG